MMREQRNVIVWPSLLAAALVAAACSDQTNLNMAPHRPSFWGGVEECPTGKWTGGGRMDPPNPDLDDGATGTRHLERKGTFGVHVFFGSGGDGGGTLTKS